VPISVELLEQLAAYAAPVPQPIKRAKPIKPAPTPIPSTQPTQAPSPGTADIESLISIHGLQVMGEPKPWNDGGTIWRLQTCPFNADHTSGSAALFQTSAGQPRFKCHHNTCKDHHWRELLALLDPAAVSNVTPITSVASASSAWPEPSPLKQELLPVEPFTPDLLPDSIRPFAVDLAKRLETPLDLPGVMAMLTVSGATNRRAFIRPKVNDDGYRIIPNLFGGVIGRPGILKSPVMSATTKPLMELEKEWRAKYAEDLEEYTAKCAKLAEGDDKPIKPTMRRLVVHDATWEKYQQLLAENPDGLLMKLDEGTSWLELMERGGREGERQFHLSAWSGDTDVSSDRIGRGNTFVPAACETIILGIQPQRFRDFMSPGEDGVPLDADGLIQRFALLVWPDTDDEYQFVDEKPDEEARRRYALIISRITELTESDPLEFRFDDAGQDLFRAFMLANMAQARDRKTPELMAGHMAKYDKAFCAIALLCQLCDRMAAQSSRVGTCTQQKKPAEVVVVSYENTMRAYRWLEYLSSHARRIYAVAGSPEQLAAEYLSDKIRANAFSSDTVTVREIQQKDWSLLKTPEKIKEACKLLVSANWLRDVSKQPGAKGGRPELRYAINPRVYTSGTELSLAA
jgi:putative DNA primase/helicase